MDPRIIEFEPLCPAAPLGGEDVATDICTLVWEYLRGQQNLLASDAYQSYSAKVTVELQLQDIDRVDLSKTIVIGALDPAKPTHTVEIAIPRAEAGEVRERNGMEEPDYAKDAINAPAKARRWYRPRQPRNKDASK
jgi:hypothetical protein